MRYQIPKYFGDMSALLKRETLARANFEDWKSLHEEAFTYALPDRETFSAHTRGTHKSRHIYDSTAIDGLEVFANKIQQGFFPEWMYWAILQSGEAIDEYSKDDNDAALEVATRLYFAEHNKTNFSAESTAALKEYGVGTGCIEVEAGRLGRNEPDFHYVVVPLAELELEPHAYGDVKNSWRRHKLSLENIKSTWDVDLPQELAKEYEKDKHFEVEILNGHLYNPDKDTYHQFIIHENTKHLLFGQVFETKRRIVFRESIIAGEDYGRGPIIRQLPNIQTLNLVKDFLLRNGAIQMAGMYTGVDDGIFNPHTVKIAPGTVIPVSSNNNQNPTLQRLESSGDIGLSQLIIKDLQDAINVALFAKPLGEIGQPVTSAMENLLRYQDDMRRSGTSFGRLFVELVTPMMLAGLDIMSQRGRFGENGIKVDGKLAKIKMVSPLSKQKELEDFQNSQIYLQNVLSLPQEIAMISVPLEKFPAYWADKLSIPSDLRRSEAEISSLSQNIMQAAPDLIGAMGDAKQ